MPVPRWVAQINKRVFNRIELKRGKRPFLRHIGRASGKTYRTPLDAHRVDNGYIFILMYGSGSDWVKNILTAGSAHLTADGDEFELVSPRLVTKDEAWAVLDPETKPIPDRLNVTEYLRMDIRR